MAHNQEELVKFGEYNTELEASLVKGLLETNGVECMMTNEVMSSVLPISFNSVGSVSVLVFKRDLGLAKKIMASNPIDSPDE